MTGRLLGTARGVATAARLERCGLRISVRRWRLQWAATAVAAAAAVHLALGATAESALPVGVAAARLVGMARRRAAARRRQDRLEVVVAGLARRLAAVLAAGLTARDAVLEVAAEIVAGGGPSLPRDLGLRVMAGASPAGAVERELVAIPSGAGQLALRRLGLALEADDGGGGGTRALEHLATAIEERRALRRRLHAQVADARMTATATPLLAAAVGVALGGPALGGPDGVPAQPALLAVFLLGATLALAGALGVRHITSPAHLW